MLKRLADKTLSLREDDPFVAAPANFYADCNYGCPDEESRPIWAPSMDAETRYVNPGREPLANTKSLLEQYNEKFNEVLKQRTGYSMVEERRIALAGLPPNQSTSEMKEKDPVKQAAGHLSSLAKARKRSYANTGITDAFIDYHLYSSILNTGHL